MTSTRKAARTESPFVQKLRPFDVKPKDGTLSFEETKDVFDAVGLPNAWAAVSAIATVAARGPLVRGELGWETLTHPEKLTQIDLDGLEKSLLEGQSGAWKKDGSVDKAKVRAFVTDVDAGDGKKDRKITLESIRDRVERDVSASVEGMREPMKTLVRKKRMAESYSAWVQLMEVAGNKAPDGTRYLTSAQVRSVFNGKLFDMILSGRPREEQVSVLRIVKELSLATVLG